jgi:hypothetical protein
MRSGSWLSRCFPSRGLDSTSAVKSGKSKQIILSVKADENLNVAQVRDLRGVIEREKAEIGVLISTEPPSKPRSKKLPRLASTSRRTWNACSRAYSY